MKVLVTGGAGYIGSHTCKKLAQVGITPVTVDSLERGHRWAVRWGPLFEFDIRNTKQLSSLLKTEKIEAVMHFAAYAYVGESVAEPLKYYENNVKGTLSLLQAMLEADCHKLVFSSSCATYGNPKSVPMDESTPQQPVNPYGQSKLISEQIIKEACAAYKLQAVALRYFNACGADSELEIGEDHRPETHLIPLALQAAYLGFPQLTVMGTDYPTPDGTCIRDYISVTDLANAHVASLGYLNQHEGFHAFNLGTGKGSSVLEIIQEVEKRTGKQVPRVLGQRRPGDPPALVAKAELAKTKLSWSAEHSDLGSIISTSSGWFVKHFLRN